MPKCKCGNKMIRNSLPYDIWLNEIFYCEICGLRMKKVPYGDPEKITYIFFVLLSLFFTKKIWFEPTKGVDNK